MRRVVFFSALIACAGPAWGQDTPPVSIEKLWSSDAEGRRSVLAFSEDGKQLAVGSRDGPIEVFDATTGKPFYHQQRLPQPENFKASPVGVDGKLYLAGESGTVFIVKMGEKFEVLATNAMEDEGFISSPVVVGGELFLRSQKRLYCISEKIKS